MPEVYLQLNLELFLEHHLSLQRRLQLALAADLRRMRVVPPASEGLQFSPEPRRRVQ